MADAPFHKLGQMIGDFIENYFKDELKSICQERGLYLDVVGRKRPARKGKKIPWDDTYGNKHDLDFVIEKNGSDDFVGTPLAFIECAWRRYTKHSKNKAQEIQGALLPIAEKYRFDKPFLGAIIAGEYTEPSITQLNSCGFSTVYLKYADIVSAFGIAGVNVDYGEGTSDAIGLAAIKSFEDLSSDQLREIFDRIIVSSQEQVNEFKSRLMKALDRSILNILISPLYGFEKSFNHLDNAVTYLTEFNNDTHQEEMAFKKISIFVKYSNGDTIACEFAKKEDALSFLTNLH